MRFLLQVQYSWLWKLANVTQSPYSYVWMNDTNTPEIINGPSKKTMYVTALYFTMTCMTVSNSNWENQTFLFFITTFTVEHFFYHSQFDLHCINHNFSLSLLNTFYLLTTCLSDSNKIVGMYYEFQCVVL